MNIATVLAITFLIIGLLAVVTCVWLMFSSLFPRFIRQSQGFYSRPGKAFLIGLGVGLVPFLIGVALNNIVIARILGWPLMLLALTGGLAGTATLATRIGIGMPSQSDRTDPWRRTLRGGVVLAFTFLLPFVGWFIWMPIALIFGAGVTFQTLKEAYRARKHEMELDLTEKEAAEMEKRLEEQEAAP